MIALLMAAQLAAAQTPLLQNRRLRPIEPSAACKSNGAMQTSGPDLALLYRNDGKALGRKLADLPKPNKEKAVLRSVDGCADPLVVQFNVGP